MASVVARQKKNKPLCVWCKHTRENDFRSPLGDVTGMIHDYIFLNCCLIQSRSRRTCNDLLPVKTQRGKSRNSDETKSNVDTKADPPTARYRCFWTIRYLPDRKDTQLSHRLMTLKLIPLKANWAAAAELISILLLLLLFFVFA